MTVTGVLQELRKIAVDKKRLKRIQGAINREFARRQDQFPRVDGFDRNWAETYPELRVVTEGYPVIREECEALLQRFERLTDVEALGGDYTKGGIHSAHWKSFMFKSGRFIEENCRQAPRTAAILRQVPSLYTAFFSVLAPHQYITPHWGYWKGFVRFHLGVVIPNDNEDQSCWLRINCDPGDNAKRDKQLVERGEKYYWKNGEGIIFDDTYLHDAKNESDQLRVVLWLDVARRMPARLHAINTLLLRIAHLAPAVARVRKRAVVDLGD